MWKRLNTVRQCKSKNEHEKTKILRQPSGSASNYGFGTKSLLGNCHNHLTTRMRLRNRASSLKVCSMSKRTDLANDQ
jgi:hypothetical protein